MKTRAYKALVGRLNAYLADPTLARMVALEIALGDYIRAVERKAAGDEHHRWVDCLNFQGD